MPTCVRISAPAPARRRAAPRPGSSLDALEDRRDALPDADAHRHEGVAARSPAPLERGRAGQAGARGPEGVAERDRAPARIAPPLVAPVDVEAAQAGHDLAGERLVQLDD